MKVFHVITGLETGGAEMTLLRLTETWVTSELRTEVLALQAHGKLQPRLAAAGAAVSSIGMTWRLPRPRDARLLRQQARAAAPDLIQGWMYHGNLAAWWAAGGLRPHPPVVWNVRHSMYHLMDERPLTAAVIVASVPLSRHVARIIYNSRVSAEQHERFGFAPGRRVVIPNGFDLERWRPDPEIAARLRAKLGVAPERPMIGLVGRLHPFKDHGNFLEAANRVAMNDPAPVFVMAGRGTEFANRDLTAMITDMGLGHRMYRLGEVDARTVIPALDLLVSSSHSEAFPNVVGEAMACGVPCVATDAGDAAWLLGGGGLVVPRREPSALAEAILELLRAGRPARDGLGKVGRARIEEHFALAAVARRYADLYAEVWAESRRD